jgi:tetratricopeptide (TPR) repeat protein
VYYAILNEYMTSGQQDPNARAAHLAALDELTSTIDIAAATPRSLSWLGTTYYLLGETGRAEEIYRKAIIAHPTDFMLMFDYVYSLEQKGQWQEAIRYLMACVALRPNVGGVWRKLGVAFREVGLLQGSFEALGQSLAVQPEFPATLVDLATTLQAMNRPDEALALVDRALQGDREMARAHGVRGRLLQEAGDCRSALEAYRKAMELKVHDPGWKAPVEQWISECRRQLGIEPSASQTPDTESAAPQD